MSTLAAVVMAAGVLAVPATAQEAPADELTGCPDGAPPADFDDVSTDNTHAEAIDCATSREVIRGVTEDTFAPAVSATRGQLTAMIARALRAADIELPAVSTPPFDDAVGTTHAADIAAMEAAGVVLGFEDGTFRPGLDVSRAQVTSIATRAHAFALGLPTEPPGQPVFDDYTEGTHVAAVGLAFELGLVQGRTADTFDPASDVRRDQFASIVNRLLGAMDAFPVADLTLTVLHINDGESMLLPDADAGMPGVARFVADIKDLQTTAVAGEDRTVVTLSSGDNFLAGPRLNASREALETAGGPFYDALVYTEAGFDAMTIGNHEFDFGPAFLAEFIAAIPDVPFLSANLDIAGEPALDPVEDRISGSTVVTTAEGVEVGVVGAVYEDLSDVTSPGGAIAGEVLPAVQAEIDALQAAEVDIILLSSHLQNINQELELVTQLSGLDAVIGGGGGERLEDFPLFAVDAEGGQVPVVTTPGNYADIGQLVLGFDAAGELIRIERADSDLLPVPMDGPEDATMLSTVVEPVQAYVDNLAETEIATTEVPLDGLRSSVRTRETNLGDLLADALLVAARDQAAAFGVPEADVALQNGGGMRNDSVIPVGPLTALTTFDVAPFSNVVGVMELDGEDLVAVIEHGLAELPEAGGQHAQWAGVAFTYDVDEPVGSRLVDATVTKADSTEVPLVVDGEVVGGSEAFVLASIDFLLSGGDAYPFDGLDFTRVGVTYQLALENRMSELGTVTADDYPDLTVDEDRYDRFGPVGGTFIN
ncbi:MAG: 5'-nucleotidase C-terminal domain-containing protein [Nitriliruptoraceae bacterium]